MLALILAAVLSGERVLAQATPVDMVRGVPNASRGTDTVVLRGHPQLVCAFRLACGLPDRNELGWRWKDSLIYVTHGVPNEPTFIASDHRFSGNVEGFDRRLLESLEWVRQNRPNV